jgi:predicted CoA-binding protein
MEGKVDENECISRTPQTFAYRVYAIMQHKTYEIKLILGSG